MQYGINSQTDSFINQVLIISAVSQVTHKVHVQGQWEMANFDPP